MATDYAGEEDDRACFPFLKLSAELRLMIYRMALRHDEPLTLSISKPQPLAESEGSDDDSIEDQLAVAQRAEEMALRIQQVSRARHIAMRRAAAMERSPMGRVLRERARAAGLQMPADPNRPPRDVRFDQPGVGGRTGPKPNNPPPRPKRNLVPNLLCLNKQINREARAVLYSENVIALDLQTSIYSINSLRQPTRSLLKHIRITIASYHDILDGFSDLVRLALRYCWGLQTLTICLSGGWQPVTLHDTLNNTCATKLYANAFHILRWLPKNASITLEGQPGPEMRRVVEQCGQVAQELDEVRPIAAPSPAGQYVR